MFITVVLALFALGARRRRTIIIVSYSALFLVMTGCIKVFAAGPRPTWMNSGVRMLDPTHEVSYGFPSGHSVASVVIYGYLAHLVGKARPKLAATASGAAAVVSVVIAISRVFNGAHFFHDVLGGLLLGYIVLSFMTEAEDDESNKTGMPPLIVLVAAIVVGAVVVSRVHYADGWRLGLTLESIDGTALAFTLLVMHLVAGGLLHRPASHRGGTVFKVVRAVVGCAVLLMIQQVKRGIVPKPKPETINTHEDLAAMFGFTCLLLGLILVIVPATDALLLDRKKGKKSKRS